MLTPQEIARVFDVDGDVIDVRPLGRGLINDTFLVTTDDKDRPHAVLQRINRCVFPQPARIMENLRVLLAHVARRTTTDPHCRELRLPAIYRTRDGRDLHVDETGDCWRVLSYIDNSRTFERLTDARQAGEVGFALGRFHELTHDLDTSRLHVTRPGFHVTPRYLARFEQVAAQAGADRAKADIGFCFAFIEQRRGIVGVLEEARQQGSLPLHVVHGDPKLDNVLFDEDSGEAVGLVDLDTVQPGLLHYDLGDCLRSSCNPAGESPSDPAEARFDLDLARAILTRYFAETRGFLSAADHRYLFEAIRLIPFELGIRFFTDHLEGNRYFKVEWLEHNLHRAMTQFRLTESIEHQAADIRGLIGEQTGD